MDTTVHDNSEKSRYELMVEDAVAGVVEYLDTDDHVELTHTEIDSSYEGEGLGSQLARAVLDTLRNQDRAVVPSCPFIGGYIQRHPEYAGLVPADRRPELGL